MSTLPPIHRSIHVSWNPEAAFRRFASDFASWWPAKTHSIGGARVRAIVFETKVGGAIYEEHLDGRRFAWGQVQAYEPPTLLRFTWHPSRAAETAQTVEIRFQPKADGTLVELTSWNWENWGKGAKTARRGYDMGWGYVLNMWAERRTFGMRVLDGIAAGAGALQALRGGRERSIARAGGEIAPAPARK